MYDEFLSVKKLENGFEVRICDPKVRAENDKPKSNWKDPWKAYAFSTSEEVLEFIGKHMSNLPKSDREKFDEAATEAFKEK